MPVQQKSELCELEEEPSEAPPPCDAPLWEAGDQEENVEEEQEEEVEEGAPSPSSCSSLSLSSSRSAQIMVPLAEGSADGGSLSPPQSPPQSPQSTSPAPSGMAGAQGSQSDQGYSSSDEEGSSPWGALAGGQALLPDRLHEKVASLVAFLLLKYLTKQPTTQAEMLMAVSEAHQAHFPVIFRQACEYLQLVFGVDVTEVDPSERAYALVTILGLSCGGMPNGRMGLPTTSLLVLILAVIVLKDDCVPEEEVWEELGMMGVYAGTEHIFYGEPRELLTNVWVQEGYLECRQVPDSEPARYEFLWGPRAHAETSSMQVLQHILRVNSRGLGASESLSLSEEAASHEE